MKFILALIFICNITSLQGQLDEALPFYNTFNDQILKAKLSFADSKKDVENIYSLKSDKKSREAQEIDLHTLKELIKKRDFEDSNREISPLIKANDAIEIITDGYTINEVVDKIIDLYNDKIPKETEIK